MIVSQAAQVPLPRETFVRRAATLPSTDIINIGCIVFKVRLNNLFSIFERFGGVLLYLSLTSQ